MSRTVFISSTSRDLGPHRAAVAEALMDAGFHPVDMAHFMARPEGARAACLKEVAGADLFIGIYAWRYGHIPDPEGDATSITEQELLEARRLGKPCFCFLVDEDHPWPEEHRDKGFEARLLRQLKERIDASLVRSTFTTPEELARKVLASLQRWEREQAGETLTKAEAKERRDQRVLLEKVRRFWIEGVLEKSLEVGLLEIAMREEPEAVEQPFDVTPLGGGAPPPMESESGVLELFGASNRALLILGTPGSGKTIMLLQLAHDLIELAVRDPLEPVPVVLSLSSWKGQPLRDWLVREINVRYLIPREAARRWLAGDELTLLLDGLDEVRADLVSPCVEGLNALREEQGLTGVAVACRSEVYEAASARLRLGKALTLQPLTDRQVGVYFDRAGSRLAGLRAALDRDPVLRKLVEQPLALRLLDMTYRGQAVAGTMSGQSVEAMRLQLVDAFVRRMLKRAPGAAGGRFGASRTRQWLSWLSRKMMFENRSVFQLEDLQPSWLSGIAERRRYFLLTRMATGVLVGLALAAAALGWLSPVPLAALFGCGLLGGALIGVADGWRLSSVRPERRRNLAPQEVTVERRRIDRQTSSSQSRVTVLEVLVSALVAVGVTRAESWREALLAVLGGGLALWLIANRTAAARRASNDIQPVESLSWSFARSLVLFLSLGVVPGLVFYAAGVRHHRQEVARSLRVWDVETGAEPITLQGHPEKVYEALFSPDGKRIATACKDRRVRLFEAATGELERQLEGHAAAVRYAAFDPGGRRLLTTSPGEVRYREDGSAAVTSKGDAVRVWDVERGDLLLRLEASDSEMRGAWSNDGRRIATTGVGREARVWDAATGALVARLEGHTERAVFSAFSPDGRRVATAGHDHTARLWDAETGAQIAVLEGHSSWVLQSRFSPDGHRVLTVSTDGTARLWDAETGAEALRLAGHKGPLTWGELSPDGSRVATAGADGTARLWDAATGVELLTLTGHEKFVAIARFSPDGRRVLTASGDSTLRVWDAESGAEELTMADFTHWARSVSFSPDGRRVVIATGVYDLRIGGLLWTLMGLALSLFGGIRGTRLELKTVTNQGIRLSARFAVTVGALATVAIAVAWLSVSSLFWGTMAWTSLREELRHTWPIGLGLSLAAGLLAALWFGLQEVLQHLYLRVVLRRAGHMPWRYGDFLDHAVDRILLRRVGGGYIFVHRLVQEYFAASEIDTGGGKRAATPGAG